MATLAAILDLGLAYKTKIKKHFQLRDHILTYPTTFHQICPSRKWVRVKEKINGRLRNIFQDGRHIRNIELSIGPN